MRASAAVVLLEHLLRVGPAGPVGQVVQPHQNAGYLFSRLRLQAQRDHRGLGRVLQRVVDQVAQHRPDQQRVGLDDGQRGLGVQGHALAGWVIGHDGLRQGLQLIGQRALLHRAALELVGLQAALDDAVDVVHRAVGKLFVTVCCRVGTAAAQHHPDHRQRRSQFVRQHRQEALFLVALTAHLLGFRQGCDQALGV